MADPVAVLPGADVPGRVQRQAAERTWRPSLADQLERAPGERPGGRGRDPHPQHSGAVLGDVVGQRLDRRVRFLLCLDHDALVVTIPGQGDDADPELLKQRQVERLIVGRAGRRPGRPSVGADWA